MQTYYARNRERLLAYQKAYHQANKERYHAYHHYYYENVTRFVRDTKPPREPTPKKEKTIKTTIKYDSGTVTEKRIRLRKPTEPPPPPPGPAVLAWDGILLDWNKL
jgi:hypothetical protein